MLLAKKLIVLLAITLPAACWGQDPLYQKVRNAIADVYPQADLQDKLLAVTFWSPDLTETRDLNKSFENVASIYRVAKLKGGRRGLLAVTINKGRGGAEAIVELKQDGIVYMLPLDAEILETGTNVSPANIVFDSAGREIYRDLAAGEVFQSILNLVTR